MLNQTTINPQIYTFENRLGALVESKPNKYVITLMADDDFYPSAHWEAETKKELLSILEEIKVFPTD